MDGGVWEAQRSGVFSLFLLLAVTGPSPGGAFIMVSALEEAPSISPYASQTMGGWRGSLTAPPPPPPPPHHTGQAHCVTGTCQGGCQNRTLQGSEPGLLGPGSLSLFGKEEVLIIVTDTDYIVTTATHADRLVMSGQIHSDH